MRPMQPRCWVQRVWTSRGGGNDSRAMHTLATGFRRTGRRYGALALIAASLFLGRTIHAAPLQWQVDITPNGELFPVLDLSQAPRPPEDAVGGGDGLVAIRVKSDVKRAFRLRVETDGLIAPATIDATIDSTGAPVELRPRLAWDRAQIETLTAPRTQHLHLRIESDGLPSEQRDIVVRLHPLDEALYYVREGRDRVDLGAVFAAYVDPSDPVVDEVLALAQTFVPDIASPVDSFGARIDRVRAVWNALELHGMRYAGDDPGIARGPSIFSQRVRLLADSWNERQANCIDSSVLIASVLERLGIPSFIVLVPRHAFIGFYADDGENGVEFLETTLLGAVPTTGASAGTAAVHPSSFEIARSSGRARWNRSAAKFDGRHRPDYQRIDIRLARAHGTLPIGRVGDAFRDAAR